MKNQTEIRALRIDGKTIHVEIEPSEHLELWRELRSSGCVGVRWDENEEISVRSDIVFRQDAVKKSLVFLESDIYEKTHGTHAACLINSEGECVIKAIDVGRHNAFDKVVATKTAPPSTGIEAAQRCGVCLVCFVSRDRLSFFTHPERIE